jgi:SAM-dependent methyltransferase
MSFFYDPFMASLEKELIKHRRFLIDQIDKGPVLEVGAGTGVNFNLYPENIEVYAIEPSLPMYKKALIKAKNKPHIHLYNIGLEKINEHPLIPEKFNFVLSTLVLCTIDKPKEGARIYKDLLTENGKLLVLEHIHSGENLYGKFQKWINPVWKPFADGCNLTRRQDIILKDEGFKVIDEKYFKLGTDWYRAIMSK